MLYIFDKEENLLEVITEYEEFNYIKKLNSERSISFTTKKNKNLKRYNKVGFFDKDKKFQLFFVDDPISFKDENTEKLSINCLADYYRLGNTIIDDKRAKTLDEALIKVLEDSDYKVGVIESFENRNINFYHINKIKSLNDILKTFSCEFDVRIEIDANTGKIANKFIDLKHRLGTDTGIRFTYDTSLENVEKSVLTEGHFNVLFGFGKSLETDNGGYSRKLDFADINNGSKYIENIESIAKYGRLEGIFEDSSIENKSILLEKTKEKLIETKNLKMSYKANIKDISEILGYEHFKVQLGDTIIILDEEESETIEARIIAIEENKTDTILTLGNFIEGLSDDSIEDDLGDLNDKVEDLDKPIDDSKYPDKLPATPILEAKGLFATIMLSWTFESKNYYTYEVFASMIKDFAPTSDNRIFEGKASSFLHEVKPSQTWYYRCRAKNTHNKYTKFSLQIEASTKKIADGTEWFEELAITHALIGSLDADKITVGKLKAQFLELYNLLLTDGNGKETFKIDDFGRIFMDVTSLKIASTDVETITGSEDKMNSAIETANVNIELSADGIKNEVSKTYTTKTEATNKINKAINDYKIIVDTEFDDIIDAHLTLEETMNTSFKDGIISEAEANSINERLVSLEKEKADIDKEYSVIISNSSLTGVAKSELISASSSLLTSYNALKKAILDGITDSLITNAEINLINAKTTLYKTASANYKEKFTKAIDIIGTKKVKDLEVSTTKKMSLIEQKADKITLTVEANYDNKTITNNKINKAINDYKIVVDTEFDDIIDSHLNLETEMNGAFKDGIISEAEANSINERLVSLEKEKADIDKEYSVIIANSSLTGTAKSELISASTGISTSYNALKKAILDGITDSLITNIEINLINSKTELYKTASANYKEKFTKALDAIQKLEIKKVNSTITENDKNTKYEISKIEQKANKIDLEVKEKVGNDEIVAKINMTSEKIKIAAKFLELHGLVEFKNLTDGRTIISGSNIKTGEIEAIDITGCNFRGTKLFYMAPNGTMACDGNTYIRHLYVPETHPSWDGIGSFRVAPTGYFDNEIRAGGEIYSNNQGLIKRSNDAYIKVDKIAIQKSENGQYLEIAGYQSNHVFGVDIWYSDANLKENINRINRNSKPASNKKIGLDLINSINHFNFNYKENSDFVDCGYIAQDLQKNNSDLVREVKQNDGSIVLEPVASLIIPNLSLAIKEQQEQINLLKEQIKSLEITLNKKISIKINEFCSRYYLKSMQFFKRKVIK